MTALRWFGFLHCFVGTCVRENGFFFQYID
jgi:hypothetical protein